MFLVYNQGCIQDFFYGGGGGRLTKKIFIKRTKNKFIYIFLYFFTVGQKNWREWRFKFSTHSPRGYGFVYVKFNRKNTLYDLKSIDNL